MIPAYRRSSELAERRPSDPRLITAAGSGDGDSGVGEIQQCYTAIGRPLFTEPGNHGLVARAWSGFDEPDPGLATIATMTHKPVRARRCLTAQAPQIRAPDMGHWRAIKQGERRSFTVCFPGKLRKLETRSCTPRARPSKLAMRVRFSSPAPLYLA